uniref:ATP synthase F0 subunit 8 n=1 Tax=Myzostoma seymourcollegiorum TaxID=447489 RepID=A6MVL4_MYZSE|nr:ATP synthase F0 subunit 8 [Myzostoma seymourcollegiorum]
MPQISPMNWLMFISVMIFYITFFTIIMYWSKELKFPNLWKINL